MKEAGAVGKPIVIPPEQGRVYAMGRMRAIFKANCEESAGRYSGSECHWVGAFRCMVGSNGMASFWADSVSLSYANVELAKQWWIQANRRWHKCPPDWDNPLPSDVALKFFACDEPILLCAQGEVERAGFDRPSPVVATIFCDQLKKAHERLSIHRISPGLIQDGDDIEFFEIRDIEGNVMQICQESCNATLAFGVTDKCIPDRVQL